MTELRTQKTWTVAEVELWMPNEGPRIDYSDRVTWRTTDGELIDVSVGGYVRDRKKWAARPIEYHSR